MFQSIPSSARLTEMGSEIYHRRDAKAGSRTPPTCFGMATMKHSDPPPSQFCRISANVEPSLSSPAAFRLP